MAVILVWTKRAIQGYDRIIKYPEKEWTEKEVRNFVRETFHFSERYEQKRSELYQRAAFQIG
jgi:hypothetical protein